MRGGGGNNSFLASKRVGRGLLERAASCLSGISLSEHSKKVSNYYPFKNLSSQSQLCNIRHDMEKSDKFVLYLLINGS